MSNLKAWIKGMKRENPKPKKGNYYTYGGNLYLFTEDRMWNRLSAVAVIEMYMADTDGGIPPELWLNKFKSQETIDKEGNDYEKLD